MTTDHQKMLEAAAKACGLVYVGRNQYSDVLGILVQDTYLGSKWFSPISHSADTASMCAKLEIGVTYQSALGFLVCRKSIDVAAVAHYKDHDNSRLKAWMFAATMCAAKTQGYEE